VRRRAALAALALLAAANAAAAPAPRAAGGGPGRPLTEMVAVLHVHSDIGDGVSSPLALARAARAAGVDVLGVTDHLILRAAWAPWPIGRVVGVAVSRPSVLTRGVGRYLEALDEAQRAVEGIVILPGYEVTPHARWSGTPWGGDLTLHGWHRHLLVFGLDDPAAVKRLPAAGNPRGGSYGFPSLAFALPAALALWAARRALTPRHRVVRLGGFELRRRRRPVLAVALLAGAVIVLYAGFPFRVERFSPVGADPGDAPERHLVSTVGALGGVSVWAHPEAAGTTARAHGVSLRTDPYPGLVISTAADAFGALPEGVRELLPPGGLWDRALVEHAGGGRPTAPRALAEIDEHAAADRIDWNALQTVFLVDERSRAGVLRALRAGRLYARWTPEGGEPLRLAYFHAEAAGRRAGAGDTLPSGGAVIIRLAIEGGGGIPVTARVVRMGRVIGTARGVPPLVAEFTDAAAPPAYYRLDVEGAYPYRLIGNPIFVRSSRGAA